jgi:tryptophan halogenase
MDNQIIRRVVIMGGGTAGFLTALALRKRRPHLEVVVVRSLKMGVIGVGEATIPSVPQFLHRFLGLDPKQFHQETKASLKLGIHFIWGTRPWFNYTFSAQLTGPHQLEYPRGYYCRDEFDYADVFGAMMMAGTSAVRKPDGSARFNPNFAYHLENRSFVAWLETVADRFGVTKIDDVVKDVRVNENGVEALILESGQEVTGDLFVDCSGFRSRLLGQALGEPFIPFTEALYNDRACIGGWAREADDFYYQYTTAETMDAGWCWQIEHDDLINRGYVYSSSFISDEDARREFLAKNPKVNPDETDLVRFRTGVHERTWVKNVIAIGNSAGFVEPLESTAIGMVCDAALHLVLALEASGDRILPVQRDIYNRLARANWLIIRDFLSLHFKFNRRLDTEYWKACRSDASIGNAEGLVDYYRKVGPDLSLLSVEMKRDFFTLEGYVTLLVGQSVPYEREVRISDAEKQKWARLKARMWDLASTGIPAEEYLQLLRTEGHDFDPHALGPGGRLQKVGAGRKMGELTWH